MKTPILPTARTSVVTLTAWMVTLFATPPAKAVDYTWNSPSSTDWNTAANWNPSSNIPGSLPADNALFASPAGLTTTSNVSSSVSLNAIRFSLAGSSGYNVTTSPSQTITLNAIDTGAGGGSDSAVNASNTSGSNTIGANILLGAAAGNAQAFTQAAGGTLVLNGVISSTNTLSSVNYLGNGTGSNITLGGANTYTANSRLFGSSSTVSVTSIGNSGASGNLGAGTAIEFFNTSTVRYTGSGETTSKGISFVNTATAGGQIDGSGSGSLNISGNVTSNGGAGIAQTLTLKGDSAAIQNRISGDISDGNGPVSVVVSSGQWTLSGTNSYSGTANRVIAGAQLNINSATALGTGQWRFDSGTTTVIDNTSAGAVTVTGAPTYTNVGSFTFTGTKNLHLGSGAVTLQASASTITTTAGVLTIGGAVGQNTAGRALTKAGAGTLILNGDNTYTGATTVSAGTLLINGNSTVANGAVAVNSGGTLGGIGTVGGATSVNSGGTISPGQSTGTLIINNNLTIAGGAGTAGGTSLFEAGDLIDVNGTLTLNTDWNLTLSGTGFQNGGTTTLFTFDTLGTFDTTPDLTFSGLGFIPGSVTLSQSGSSIVLNGISVVPEPSTGVMLLSAFGMLLALQRGRRRQPW